MKFEGECFVKFPASLITELSDTSLRILLYAIDRQGLVTTGNLKIWHLNLADVENQFRGKQRGYSRNTIRKGFKELAQLGLLRFKSDHYELDVATLQTYLRKHREYSRLPKSGSHPLPESGIPALPISGTQEKKRIEEIRMREEKAEATILPPVKTPEESFDDIFCTGAPVQPKTFEEQFMAFFSADSVGEAHP